MITAMNIATAIIIVALAAVLVGLGVRLYRMVHNDGLGGPSTGRPPPRSHYPDQFEPRWS
jgi:hypothetical protein